MHLPLPVPNITIGDSKSEVGFGPKAPALLSHSFETVLQNLSVEGGSEQPLEEPRTEEPVQDEDDGPESELTSDASEMDEFLLLEEEPHALTSGHSEQPSQRVENVTPPDDVLYSKSTAPTEHSEARSPEATLALLRRSTGPGSGNHTGLVESAVSKPSAAASSGAPFSLNYLTTGHFISRPPDATMTSPSISRSRVAEPVAQDQRVGAVMQSHMSASQITSGYDRSPESDGGEFPAPEGLEKQSLPASRPFQAGFEASSERERKEPPSQLQAAGAPVRMPEAANTGFPPAVFPDDARQGDANRSTSSLPGQQQLEGKPVSVPMPLIAAQQKAEQPTPPGEGDNLQFSNVGAGFLTSTEAQTEVENKDARSVEASVLNSANRMGATTDPLAFELGRNASVQMPVAHTADTATKDAPSTSALQATSPREWVPKSSNVKPAPVPAASSYPVTNASFQDSALVLSESGGTAEIGIEDASGVGPVVGIEASSPQPLARQVLSQASGVGRQVLQQLVDIPLQPNERIEITLAPEELGRIRLSATQSDQGVVLLVQAERPETLDLMRRHLPDLLQDLQALGFSDVGYSDQQNQGQKQEHASQSEASVDVSPPDIAQQAQPASGLDLRL